MMSTRRLEGQSVKNFLACEFWFGTKGLLATRWKVRKGRVEDLVRSLGIFSKDD